MKLTLIILTCFNLLGALSYLYDKSQESANLALKKEQSINLALSQAKLLFPDLTVEKKDPIAKDPSIVGGCINSNSIYIVPEKLSSNYSSKEVLLLITHERYHCLKYKGNI